MSWDFGGDQHLAVSIETRKEKGESVLGGRRLLQAVRAPTTSPPTSAT